MNDKDQSTIDDLYNFIYDFGGFPFVEIPSLNDSKSLNIDQTMIKRFKYHNHTLKLFHQSLKQQKMQTIFHKVAVDLNFQQEIVEALCHEKSLQS